VQRRYAELVRRTPSTPAPSCTASPPRQTAERILNGRLRLYPDKGHASMLTRKRAIREIVAFLRADDQPRT
jgi:hypothetical protein